MRNHKSGPRFDGASPLEAAERWLDAGRPGRSVAVLVRHGAVANPQGLRYGRLPGFGLSAQGIEQAEALAAAFARLRPWARSLRTSPLERAVQTAQPLARALGLEAMPDERLIESWSVLDGRSRHAWLAPAHWPLLLHPLRPAWAEPFEAVAARMTDALHDTVASTRGGLAVHVSHQSPIWLGVQAAELEVASGKARLLRFLPPWLRRPLRCATGTATMLLFENGVLVQALPPWRPQTTATSGSAR